MPSIYNIAGLIIESELPLPEATPSSDGVIGATIRLAPVDRSHSEDDQETCFSFTSTEAYLYWKETGTFVVRNGTEIIVDPIPGVEERQIRLPLLGTVLAILLHQRGYLVFHGSAMAINGQSIVFLGEKGEGKSTIAAMLYANGHTLVADDLVVLDLQVGQQVSVYPAIPQFKLWPESVTAIGDDPGLLSTIAAGIDKRARFVTDRMATHSLPLKHIYILAPGQTIHGRLLPPGEAFTYLVAHTYVARFGNQLLTGGAAIEHLRQCRQVLSSTAVSVLERPRSLALLPDIGRYLEDCYRPSND